VPVLSILLLLTAGKQPLRAGFNLAMAGDDGGGGGDAVCFRAVQLVQPLARYQPRIEPGFRPDRESAGKI